MTFATRRPRERRALRPLFAAVVGLALAVALPPSAAAANDDDVYIVQTNAAGDNVHVIDPATNEIVAEITGVEVIHGVAASPDGSRLYLSNESTHALDIVDTKTLEVRKSIPLSGRPNNVAIHENGERLYVAIRGVGGGVDVIDTELERPVWAWHFEGGVRPFTFDTNPDGSTKNMYVQISNLHGFAVVDWEQRREVRRIVQPDIPEAERNVYGIQGAPAHGIKITPDSTTIWSTSKINGSVYAYSLPDLELLGGVKVGVVPDWLTFTPDSKYLYVANAHSNTVSVVDVAAREEVEVIQVGQVPKRNITARLPDLPVGQ